MPLASPSPLSPNAPSPDLPSQETDPESAVTASSAEKVLETEKVPETTDPADCLPTHPILSASYFGTYDLEAFNPFLDMIGDALG